MSKGKRVRITNDSLNSYGTRVLTAGMNVEQYQRNPVLLYMHERGNVIGYVKDLKVEEPRHSLWYMIRKRSSKGE